MAGDIAILWNEDNQAFDWARSTNGDIADTQAAGMSDLETSVVISLFTNRTAPPDWKFPQTGALSNPGGWWGDAYNDIPIGSHLWLLRQQSGAPNLLQIARTYCQDALQWVLDNNITSSIDVTTSWLFPNSTRAIYIEIVITEPVTNKTSRFQYSYAWKIITNVPETPPTVHTP